MATQLNKTEFRVTGMTKPASFTFFHYTNWWATSSLSKEEFNTLFDKAKSEDAFWKGTLMATVEHEGLSEDGTPIKGKVVKVNYFPFDAKLMAGVESVVKSWFK